MVRLAWPWQSMERPNQLSCAHVPGADVAGSPECRELAGAGAGEHIVLVEADGGGYADPRSRILVGDDTGLEIDHAIVAEGRSGFPGLRIHRHQPSVAGPIDDLRRKARSARPVTD